MGNLKIHHVTNKFMKRNFSLVVILGGIVCVFLILAIFVFVIDTNIETSVTDEMILESLDKVMRQPKNITVAVSESLDVSGVP